MRRAALLASLVFLAGCRTAQPAQPLEGSYALVFDPSFMTTIRMPVGAYSGGEIEKAVRELFSQRSDV